jgi:cytosine/adenosine deaminase-related metal-dependent hydrolase
MNLRATLYTARWILPVAQPAVCAAGMLVDAAGRIERIGPAHSFNVSNDVARIDLGECVIAPGLVNVHAHPELSIFRGLLEDLPFHAWIPTLLRCKRDALLTYDDYVAAAQWTCIESLRAGITTMGATEDSGAAVQALHDANMRGVVYLETFGPAPEQVDQSMDELRAKIERHASLSSDRIRLGVSPHAPYSVSDALYAAVAAYAQTEDFPVATHTAESEAEELLVRAGAGPFAAGLRTRGIATSPLRGRSTIDLLERTGVLACAPLLIHAVRASGEDLRAVAAAGASIAHCPIANARLGHGVAPITEALTAGIRVAIATDSVASNNRIDLLEEAHFAQAMQRARLESASALPSEQLLRMTTIEGARILGFDACVGTLEPGKEADFCAISLAASHSLPVVDPIDSMFHSARGSDVVMTVVAGHALFIDGKVTTLNEATLREQVSSIAQRLVSAKASA